MNQIKEETFLEIVKAKGIVTDSQYPKFVSLLFENAPDIWCYWEMPGEARRLPYFIDSILEPLAPWDSIYVWKHHGSWVPRVMGERLNDDVQAVIYRGLGIFHDNADILEFNKGEYYELITLIFNQLVFGWHVGDDLYLVPDHGKQIARTSHHDAVYVSFRDEPDMEEYIAKMAEKGFEPPEDMERES